MHSFDPNAKLCACLFAVNNISEDFLPSKSNIDSPFSTSVITVFGVCWLPYHTYFISIYLWPSLIQTPGIKHIFLAFYWFAMANSLFNPIILFAMNRRYVCIISIKKKVYILFTLSNLIVTFRIRNYIIYYLKFTCCLFGLHERFSRRCRRSSFQMMMIKKGISQPQHQHANSSQVQHDLPNRCKIKKLRQCEYKQCGFSKANNHATSDDDSNNRQVNDQSSYNQINLRCKAIHQEQYDCNSINSNSNQNCSANQAMQKNINEEEKNPVELH